MTVKVTEIHLLKGAGTLSVQAFRLLAIFLSFLYVMDFNTMMQHIIKKAICINNTEADL